MILYFVEQQRVNLNYLNEVLPGRFDTMPAKRECSSGPGNKSGLVLARDSQKCRFDAEMQVWHKLIDGVWFGWDGAKLDPETILRTNPIGGEVVTIDGMRWMIPKAREFGFESGNVINRTTLQRAAKYDPESKEWIAGDVVNSQQRIFEIAELIFDEYTKNADSQSDSAEFNLPDNPLDLCVELIASNYFIGPEEISALGLLKFSFESCWAIMRLVIDEPGIAEMVQKKMAYAQSLQSVG